MKVLLILSNRDLHRALAQAILIWIITCLAGCVAIFMFSVLLFPPVKSLLLSLAFSSPALLVAVPFLHRLHVIPTIHLKIGAGVGIILFTSGGIIGIVTLFFNLSYAEVAEVLLPFVPSALLAFIVIIRKQLRSKIVCQ